MVERRADGSLVPIIMDFGLAREASENRGLTETGALMGTPSYMSPEQARGDLKKLDRRADVYSLGATLYELLSGRPPFVGEQVIDVLMSLLSQEAPSLRTLLPQLPIDLSTIVMKCLAKDPSERYDSARALGEDLARYINGEPILGRPATLASRMRRRIRLHWPLYAVGSFAVLCLLVVGGQELYIDIQARKHEQAARRQTEQAQYVAQEIKNVEWLMRSAYQLPLHDVSRERNRILQRIERLDQRMQDSGSLGPALAHDALGRGYLTLKDYEKARAHLQRAIELGYETPAIDYALGVTLGKIYEASLDELRGEGDIGWFRKHKPELDQRYLPRINELLNKGRASDSDSTSILDALIPFYNEEYARSTAIARSIFAETPWLYEAKELEADVHLHLAKEHRHDGKYEKAQQELTQALHLYEEALAVGRSDPALYEAVAELWDTQLGMDREEGKLSLEKLPLALSACDKAVTAAPWRAFGYLRKSWMYQYISSLTPKHLEDGIAAAQQAVKRAPEDYRVYDVLGASLQAAAKHHEREGLDASDEIRSAISNLERSLELHPSSAPAYNKLGNIYLSLVIAGRRKGKEIYGDYLNAVTYYERALAINPDIPLVYSNLIAINSHRLSQLAENGRFDDLVFEQSKKLYATCKSKNPAFLFCDLGFLYVLNDKLSCAEESELPIQGDYDALIALADTVASRHPNDAYSLAEAMSAHLVLARRLVRSKQDPTAALQKFDAAFAECRRRHPEAELCTEWEVERSFTTADWLAGRKLPITEPLTQALAAAQRAVDENPRSAESRGRLAEAYLRLGRALGKKPAVREQHLRDGSHVAEQALRLNPSHPRHLATYGALLLERARTATALDAARDLAGRAQMELDRALSLNKWLGRDYGALLTEAKTLHEGR